MRRWVTLDRDEGGWISMSEFVTSFFPSLDRELLLSELDLTEQSEKQPPMPSAEAAASDQAGSVAVERRLGQLEELLKKMAAGQDSLADMLATGLAAPPAPSEEPQPKQAADVEPAAADEPAGAPTPPVPASFGTQSYRTNQGQSAADAVPLFSCALITGAVAGALSVAVHLTYHHLGKAKFDKIYDVVGGGGEDTETVTSAEAWNAWGTAFGFMLLYALGAGICGMYDPTAQSSGLPSILSLLNGLRIDGVVSLSSLCATVVGTPLYCAAPPHRVAYHPRPCSHSRPTQPLDGPLDPLCPTLARLANPPLAHPLARDLPHCAPGQSPRVLSSVQKGR